MAGTIAVPGRQAPVIPASPEQESAPTFKTGPIAVPDRIGHPILPTVENFGESERYGPVELAPRVQFNNAVTPAHIGENDGNPDMPGLPVTYVRRWEPNTGGMERFIPPSPVTGNWTANEADTPAYAKQPIPIFQRFLNWAGYRREQYVDEQLFIQPVDYKNPWPIQPPIPRLVSRRVKAQAQMTSPYYNLLTRLSPAASYGATTQTLLAMNLVNTLTSTNPQGANNPSVMGGSPYGSY